jgi:hypothetical protein
MGGPSANPAEFLLANTGELRLTDAQVTRLAAIARRSAERRRAMRTRFDSLRPEVARGGMRDSATRARLRQRAEEMRPEMERLREQSQADRRDAIAVLTPDQQAQAWERIAAAGRGMRADRPNRGRVQGMRGQGMREQGMRRRMGRQGMDGRGAGPRRMGPPEGRPDGERRPPAPEDRRRPDTGQ